MSFLTPKAEIGEGDKIQVRSGKRMFDATITGVEIAGTALTVHCEITGEVPAWVMEQLALTEAADRERAERKAARRSRWRR